MGYPDSRRGYLPLARARRRVNDEIPAPLALCLALREAREPKFSAFPLVEWDRGDRVCVVGADLLAGSRA